MHWRNMKTLKLYKVELFLKLISGLVALREELTFFLNFGPRYVLPNLHFCALFFIFMHIMVF